MRAGRLRHRVVLKRLQAGRDGLGQPVPDKWEVMAGPLPAEVKDLSGSELLRAQHDFGKVTSVILMRYVEGVESGMQAVHVPPTGGGEIYHIVVGLIDVRRRQLEIYCHRGVRHE